MHGYAHEWPCRCMFLFRNLPLWVVCASDGTDLQKHRQKAVADRSNCQPLGRIEAAHCNLPHKVVLSIAHVARVCWLGIRLEMDQCLRDIYRRHVSPVSVFVTGHEPCCQHQPEHREFDYVLQLGPNQWSVLPMPQTQICTDTPTHITHRRARTHACMHTRTHAHPHTRTQMRIVAQKHASTQARTRIPMHAHTRACTHIRTHIYAHT